MLTIKQLLDKIKWDPREVSEDYTLFYYDRIEQKEKELRYTDIGRIEEGFMFLQREGKEVHIPLHRIRKVVKTGKVVWQMVL